jgi:hypothetical protein
MRDWRWWMPTLASVLAFSIFYRFDCSGAVYLTGFSFLVGATALVWLLSLGDVRGTDHRRHGRRTGFLYIGVTYGFAAAYALLMYRTYQGSKDALGNAGKDFMLTSGLVGGVLALFRSTGTNSAVLATLNRLDRLDRELGACSS